MARSIGTEQLLDERHAFRCTGGVSENNRSTGFVPAFLDTATGVVHLSRYADGTACPCHSIDGLPDALVAERDADGHVLAIEPTVLAGFELGGLFYTREQAARLVAGNT